MQDTTGTAAQAKTGAVVHAARFVPQSEVPEWCRSEYPDGWLLTGCNLSLALGCEIEAEVTCGNCRRVRGGHPMTTTRETCPNGHPITYPRPDLCLPCLDAERKARADAQRERALARGEATR